MFALKRALFTVTFILIVCTLVFGDGILYPRESESREVKSLDGIWHFRTADIEDQELGFKRKWFQHPLQHVSIAAIIMICSILLPFVCNSAL